MSSSKSELNVQEYSKPLTTAARFTILWFIVDAITHLTLELGYVLTVAFYGGAKYGPTTGIMGAICEAWRLYSKADPRWEVFNADVMTLEILTVFLMGPLALLAIYAVYTRQPYRHLLQFAIGICELYGGWMTFAPEWVTQALFGTTQLRGAPFGTVGDMVLWWIYLLFMNGLWVLIPIVLCWDSAVQIIDACNTAKVERAGRQGISDTWYYICFGALVLYCILIPAVLSYPELVD
eukprot:gb/GECG01010344.1/.p1 GENE.gb/GECG01010344.1/~~gb/GECG01010344.1/.p1  ORF type:complete len:236 (+),score=15.99 gb/GECG01010344.1/:1-708(+)